MKREMPSLKFKKEDTFYKYLRAEVNSYFKNSSFTKKATSFWYIKAWSLISMYVITYSCLLVFGKHTSIVLISYAVLGILAILLGLNVGHDAAHGSISKNQAVNRRYAIVFDLLGGNSYIWRIRHIYAHHPYPNVIGFDSDIKQSKLVRIFPKDVFLKFHKFQHIYTPILLIFSYTLNWFLIRDFKDFYEEQFGKKIIKKHPRGTFRKIILCKCLYISFIFFIPLSVIGISSTVFLGFLLMNIFSGIIISVALVSTHVGDHHEFPTPNKEGDFEHTWSTHQIITTSDFCTNSTLANFFFGGFNHHVIHHLFPEINHVHYVNITPVLRKTALAFHVNYRAEENLFRVFKSHINLLKREGYEHGLLHQEI
ncbi:fatty acid desaturase [uncultured Dokdonia sp.]|uniref:fatty acid desaturase family protein n=1 Tax=uncultured Dokdonia sp. TaxID=575653 RepID=UPI00260259D7|nr:fatty acid desaturase [uncultured Dokdonia sp.]